MNTAKAEGMRRFATLPGAVRGSAQNFRKEDEGYGAVLAIDPKTGEKKWEFKMTDVTDAGILTTASNLLFTAAAKDISSRLMQRLARPCGKRQSEAP